MDMTTGATLQSLQEAVLQRKPKITARDCNVYYGEKHALKHVDVDIPERSVTAFIGPSGCGIVSGAGKKRAGDEPPMNMRFRAGS